ncbi:MAG: 4'-phosphopantetheinyl transferase superfamily protein [Salinivirgaceae bacterium]|nr:4'-phosphopantetheinyl transferase superfamily protein [Salinivirgaceae bacterium]
MPLLFTQTIGDAVLGVWSKLETAEQLLPMICLHDADKAVYEQIGNDRRRTEWLTTRIVLRELLNRDVTIAHDSNSKPYIAENKSFISISHSKNMVAVMVAEQNLGIDIEQITARTTKVRHKFLTGNELGWCKTDIEHTLVWTVKEAAYKLIGSGLEHTEVEIEQNPNFMQVADYNVVIRKSALVRKNCHSQLIGDNILSYIIG